MLLTTVVSLSLLATGDSARYESEFVFPPERFHNHSSSIVETADGDLITCWFHGRGERKDDTLVTRGARKNHGESQWSAPFVMGDNPETRIRDIKSADLLTDDEKAQILVELEERRTMRSDKLLQRLGWMTRQPPVMLSDKRMMLGLYSDTFDCAMFAFTEDARKNWQFSRPLAQSGIQPSVAQRKNGELVAYMRDSPITRCAESSDGGMTWAEVPLDILNSGSSVAVLRLISGNWILAVNDVPRGRHQLSLYLSQDEGHMWVRRRYLEKRDPKRGKATASYPTLIQAADGVIHVTYTHEDEATFQGKTIKHAWFNEAWILTGSAHVDDGISEH